MMQFFIFMEEAPIKYKEIGMLPISWMEMEILSSSLLGMIDLPSSVNAL